MFFLSNNVVVAQMAQEEKPLRVAKIYTIYDISIDETARSANLARRTALAKGQRQALGLLLNKIIRMEDIKRLPEFADPQVAELVSGFEVLGEKTSNIRYIAKLTVHFSRQKIYDLLSQLDIPFAETLSNPVSILPVLEQGGAVVLWQKNNHWLTAWQDFDTINHLVPLNLPVASFKNKIIINARQARNGRVENILEYKKQNGIERLYIVMARVERAISRDEILLHLTIREGETGALVFAEEFARKIDPEYAGLDIEYMLSPLYQQAMEKATYWIDDQWKQRVLVHFDTSSQVKIKVVLEASRDWFDIGKRLENISLIRMITLKEISTHTVIVAIDHVGDMDQVRLALTQENIDLKHENEEWVLSIGDKDANE